MERFFSPATPEPDGPEPRDRSCVYPSPQRQSIPDAQEHDDRSGGKTERGHFRLDGAADGDIGVEGDAKRQGKRRGDHEEGAAFPGRGLGGLLVVEVNTNE